jgi:hypothetical protein
MWEKTTVKHAEAPALSAPGASLRSKITDRQTLQAETVVSRRQADLGAEEPSISEELLGAWRSDACCAECGKQVAAAADAALLVGPNRVVHRDRCFVPALLRANPLLKILAARRSAQEVTITPQVPTGRSDTSEPRAEPRAPGGNDA